MVTKSRDEIMFNLLNTSFLVIVLIIVLYPLVFVLSASISNPMSVMRGEVLLFPKDISFTGYKRVFSDPNIWTGFKNTLTYTFLGTTLNVILTIMGAYPLSRKRLPGRRLLMLFLIITMFFNGGLIPTYMVIQTLDMINTVWVMIIPGAVSVFNLIVMRTFFEQIPVDMTEAAMMDGCSNIRTLLHIVLPVSLPIIAVMILFYGVHHWNSYFNALIYLSDRSHYPIQLFAREILIQNEMQQMMDMADESAVVQQMNAETVKYALIIVTSLPVLVLYPFLQRYFVKGIMIGAIKG